MKLLLPQKDTHRKRLNEWEAWLKNFRAQNIGASKFKYIPNAAWLLNDLYWRIAEQYLRPVLKTELEDEEEHRIHPYKIISASEITVMMTEPIEVINDDPESRRLNAGLAWFIATQIIEGWDTGSVINVNAENIATVAGYRENIEIDKRYPESFAAEHIQWLVMLNVTIEKPLLLNAQCWRLFYLTCLSVAGKGKLK